MPVLRVFDPAMCCSTGVCGPSSDPELARFAADLDWLQKQGVKVERYNLSAQPAAFAETAVVREALAKGTEVLPLVLVDDRIAVEGSYPTRETLAALAGVVVRKLPLSPAATPAASEGATGCCGSTASAPGAAKPKTSCC
jgi:hypothetical protein